MTLVHKMPLTQEQNNMYAASFKDADLNGDGKISAAELKALLCDKLENVNRVLNVVNFGISMN